MHLKKTSGLLETEVLYFKNEDYAKSYNHALKDAKNDVIVFVREDVEIHSDNWGEKLLESFAKTEYAILGVVGSIIVPMSGLVWEKEEPLVGRVWYETFDQQNENKFSEVFKGKIIPVIIVDDPFFAVKRSRLKKEFDERYVYDSFYDIDFCIANYVEGAKVGVFFDVKILKLQFNEKDESWKENRKLFVSKHRTLPLRMKPDIIANQSPIRIEKPPKVTVVIAGKNKPIELASSLESIYEKTHYPNFEILVVDLGSEKDDVKAISDFLVAHGNSQLVEMESDHLPGVYDEVLQKHVSQDTELLFFCDPEIIFLNDIISRMVKVYLENPEECGTLGCRMHMRNNMVRHTGLQLFSTETDEGQELGLGFLGFQSAYKYRNKVVKNVLGCTKDCLMISKALYEQVGGFNKEYMHSLEDFELNIRTILEGKKNMLVGTAVCYYLGPDVPKFLPDDFMNLVNFVNEHLEVITPYVDLLTAA